MSIDVVRQFYSVYHDQQLERLNDILAPNYVGQVNGREIVGADAARAFIAAFLAAFPDVHYTLHDTITCGEKVTTRWTATATHRGSFAGIEPTHKAVTMTGITIFEVSDGRIQALWNAWDMFGLVQQLRA